MWKPQRSELRNQGYKKKRTNKTQKCVHCSGGEMPLQWALPQDSFTSIRKRWVWAIWIFIGVCACLRLHYFKGWERKNEPRRLWQVLPNARLVFYDPKPNTTLSPVFWHPSSCRAIWNDHGNATSCKKRRGKGRKKIQTLFLYLFFIWSRGRLTQKVIRGRPRP